MNRQPHLRKAPMSRANASREELETIAADCARADWDGEGAKPVTSGTVKHARAFLEQLAERMPASLAYLSLRAEPDGDINFEWREHKDFLFEVSVGEDGSLNYAGRFGDERARGRARIGEKPSAIVADCLQRFGK